MNYKVTSAQEAARLFPKTPQEIQERAKAAMERAKKQIDDIIAISDEQRTFENTARALDIAGEDLSVDGAEIATLMYVHPQEDVRNQAQVSSVEMSQFAVEAMGLNKKLYEAFKAYAEGNAKKEDLNSEEQYFISETMKGYKRSGLDLPEAELEKVRKLSHGLTVIGTDFDVAINKAVKRIPVTKNELAGLEDEFIESLEKTEDGNYILGVDYPTYTQVMENCSVGGTRQKLWQAFVNRAYPENIDRLNKIIALRDEMARVIGYQTYAHLNIDDSMAQTPQKVQSFLDEMVSRSDKKVAGELERYLKELPEGITLEDGKIKPWDWAFIKNEYKKKHHAFDERVVAEYFPVDSTIEALLNIYEQFLGVRFKSVAVDGLWHPDVRAVEVSSVDGQKLGYLFLDLFPRPNKYTHACHIGVVPALKDKEGNRIQSSVGIVVANFPKSSPSKPSLLMHSDVVTFFHEFGHAIHALLGATEMAGFSGTSVKTDFVEMPSQMLEEWMWDPAIIAMVSKHYKTGAPMPAELIATLVKFKNYDAGDFVKRQSMLSRMSLDYFMDGKEVDTTAKMQALMKQIRPYVAIIPDDHFQASFGHLVGYGAQYYGYLWSRVYAMDLFEAIKKQGLLNPEIGKRYTQSVIGMGGSRNPMELLKDFLGREPRSDAFFRDMGLDD